MDEVATSNFDVGSSSGTSDSVIKGLHNRAVQVDTGSMDEQNSHVQEINLGHCANEQQTSKLQNLVEGSDYQGCGNRDNATSLEDGLDKFFDTITLPAIPVTYAIAEHRALRAFRGDYEETMSLFERLEIEREKAALSEETIMKRLVTRSYVPSTASGGLESLSGGDYSEQICGICMAGYEDQDEIGVLYYCTHEFHADCLKTWLLKQNTCPDCRRLALIPAHIPDWIQNVDVHRAFFLTAAEAVERFPFFKNFLCSVK